MMPKAILLFLLCCTTLPVRAQKEIDEKNFLRADSLLWSDYERETARLVRLGREMPSLKDSLMAVREALLSRVLTQNEELAVRYAATPSGLERLYMVRLGLDKSRLDEVWRNLPPQMQQSLHGNNLRLHLDTRQMTEGDTLRTFPCHREDGKPFCWEDLRGKPVLLIYGGLGCMGQEGRMALQRFSELAGRTGLVVLIYEPASSVEALADKKRTFGSKYPYLSNFNNPNLMPVLYGAQASPTCFFFDRRHVLRLKSTGLDTDRLAPLLP